MATKSEIVETGLTKGELRKLNALRKSVGPDIGEKAFAQWLKKAGVGKEAAVESQAVKRRLAAIVSVDVVGNSRLMEADEAGTHQALKQAR